MADAASSDQSTESGSAEGRSGFVTFVGRPNVGKSTLTNALVGEKVAITSDKPQTTRRAIRGILNRPAGQLVIVDTPGLHKPRTLLGERLNYLVEQVLGDVDVIGFLVPANEKVGPGDRRIAESLSGYSRAKKVAIVTKTDAATREQITERLLEVDALREDWDAVIPLSALDQRPARCADRRAARAHAGRPAALPGRRGHRRVERGPHRRDHPRGGSRRGARRAAALDRGGRAGHREARGHGPHRHLGRPRRRARQPEGDHHRAQGLAAGVASARGPGPASSR